jgi:hypothetical protein
MAGFEVTTEVDFRLLNVLFGSGYAGLVYENKREQPEQHQRLAFDGTCEPRGGESHPFSIFRLTTFDCAIFPHRPLPLTPCPSPVGRGESDPTDIGVSIPARFLSTILATTGVRDPACIGAADLISIIIGYLSSLSQRKRTTIFRCVHKSRDSSVAPLSTLLLLGMTVL